MSEKTVAGARWRRFSLASVFMALFISSVFLAWWRDHEKLQGRADRNARLVEMLMQKPPERMVTIAAPSVPDYESPEQYVADLQDREEWFLQNSLAVRSRTVGEAAAPALIELLADDDQETRVRAAGALGKLASPPEIVLDALLRAFEDPDPRFHYSVVCALGDLGSEAGKAKAILLAALDDPAESHPAAAAMAVWKIGSDPQAVDALSRLLTHEDADQRTAAADYLRIIGAPHAQTAVGALMKATKDDDPTVRCTALTALAKLLSAEDAMTVLAEAGKDKDRRVRSTAAALLRSVGR